MWLGIVAGEGVKMILLGCFVATSNWQELAHAAVARAELEEQAEQEDVERLAIALGMAEPNNTGDFSDERTSLLLN